MFEFVILFFVGGIASGINSIAGGGSLISFPTLTLGFHFGSKVANATNAVGLWPGSLGGAIGFRNLLSKTAHHLRSLWFPTLAGAILGSWLLTRTNEKMFNGLVPFLLLLAAILLAFQPQVRRWALRDSRVIPAWSGIGLQFLVAIYGGYFGAGMGIMMLACFSLYMDGTLHEINAVKTWLGVVINLASSAVFFGSNLVLVYPALALALGSIVGGFLAAVVSQKFDPEKLRIAIAVYGIGMAVYFAIQTWR